MLQFIDNLKRKMAVLQARYTIELSMHPIIMLICFFVSAMHTWITVLLPNSQVVIVIKYLEPTMLINNQVMLYIFAVPVITVIVYIVREIFQAFVYQTIVLNTVDKYLTKTIGNLGWIACFVFTLPVVRTSIYAIKQLNGFSNSLGWIVLLLYSIVLVPFYGFFLQDPSPCGGNSYATVKFFNYYRIMPFISLIMAYANVLQKTAHVSFVYSFLIISLLFFLKEPIMFYSYDRYYRLMIYLMTWIMMVRGTANIDNAPVPGAAVALVAPIFVTSLFWITDIRINRILYSKKQTIKKYVYFVYMLKNFFVNLKSTLLFLLYHRKQCENPQCNCRILDSWQGEENKDKHINWYKFAISAIQKNFNVKLLQSLLPSEKKILLAKLVDIVVVKVDIMSNILKKWISSYYYLQKIHSQCEQQKWTCHIFHSYRLKFIKHLTDYLQQTCLHDDIINKYASSYFQYQNEIQNLVSYLQKSTQSHLQIWKELKNYQPDFEKLCGMIRKNYRYQKNVQHTIKNITRNNKEAKKIIMGYYQPYFYSVCNNFIQQISITEPVHVEKLSQQMQNFSIDSKTATGLVNISQGQQFGKIINTNLYFELMTEFSSKDYLNVDELIPFGQEQKHRDKMKNYLNKNEIYKPEIKGFIKTKSDLLKFAQILIQIYPSAMNGLMACAFIIETEKKNIFCCNKQGRILSYNQQFKKNIYELYSYILKEQSILSHDNLQMLVSSSKCEIILESDKFQIATIHIKGDPESSDLKYICSAYSKIQVSSSFENNSQKEIPSTNIQLQCQQPAPKSNLLSSQAKQSQSKEFKNKNIQKQQLEQIFSIVENNKSVTNIKIWIVCLILLFLSIQSLIIASIATTFKKQNLLVDKLQMKDQFQNSLSNIVNSLYFLRRANIAANYSLAPENFTYNQQICSQYNKQASENLEKSNLYTRKMKDKLISISTDKIITQNEQDYYTTLQQKVLVVITNFKDAKIQDLQFPLKFEDLEEPLNSYQQNFFQVNLNALKLSIPQFNKIAGFINQDIRCQIGGCVYLFAPVYILPIIIILNLVIIMASCFVTYKVKSIKYSTYKLLIEFPEQDITTREERIGKYVSSNIIYQCDRNNFGLSNQLSSNERQQLGGTLKIIQKNIKILKHSSKNANTERFLTKQICLQDTHRQLFGQKEELTKQVPAVTQKKKKRRIIFKELSKSNILCKYSLVFIPGLLLIISMIILFYISNAVSLREVDNLNLLYQRMITIHEIKLYDLQIGFENSPIFPNQVTVQRQLNQFISHLYEIQRKIKQVINPKDGSIGQIINQFNQENICTRLGKLSLTPNYQVKYTKQECQNLVGTNYLTKGMMNSLVSFLQQSRIIQQNYHQFNESVAQFHNFLGLSDHELFNKLDYYFTPIIKYQIEQFKRKIIQHGQVSSIVMLILGLFLSFYIWVSLFILLTRFKKAMFKDITEIKSIYQLISQQTIKNNKKLSKIAIQENDYGFLK